ncbi:hypothetical protein, partial [Pseudonocardia lacus]|uniref:hypothetical protein n=1 Tax=Pseudonocardia lacus TaxID=2835865 RepID=UPI001BDCB577
ATVVAAVPARRADPAADPRATGFGFGVPLRPRIGVGQAVATALVRVRGRAVAAGDEPPETDDRTVPRWQALPVAGRAARMPGEGCGCGGVA